jgi:hypothetical protein
VTQAFLLCKQSITPVNCPDRVDDLSFALFSLGMAIHLKTAEEVERMRVAGQLAAEVLDFVAPRVKPGVTTGELDRLCHDLIVEEQKAVPAPLNYAPPGYKPSRNRSALRSITRSATASRASGS